MNNMTQGSPLKHILKFAFPVWLGILFQQFYSVADTVIVGRFLGLNQLAGVGATSIFSNLVIWFFGGLCNGFCIPVAQNFGGKRYEMVRRYLSAGIRLAMIIVLCGTTVLALTIVPILQALKTPAEIFPYAHAYILVIILGVPFTMVYNYSASCIRSLGDSRTPFLMLVFASLLNIVLDLVFILWLGLGVRGAALATVI
ncbi:MAG: polysaccharide biosynthesis C-terminal domain-containing protein, partial [Solobacterium sp.]|nr:polysaccharide biosynthesis C-terminal domain-containing protein [Solobacterium sp.]